MVLPRAEHTAGMQHRHLSLPCHPNWVLRSARGHVPILSRGWAVAGGGGGLLADLRQNASPSGPALLPNLAEGLAL